MPTYEYVCTKCQNRVEVVQSFSDAPLTTCAVCEGTLKRVFHPVGIVLKGSGFYATDSRSNKALSPSKKEGSSSEGGGSEGGNSSAPANEKTSASKDSVGSKGDSGGSSGSGSTKDGGGSKDSGGSKNTGGSKGGDNSKGSGGGTSGSSAAT